MPRSFSFAVRVVSFAALVLAACGGNTPTAANVKSGDDAKPVEPADIVITDRFAKDAGTPGGKAEALEMYAAQLGKFFRDRWAIPSSISVAEASRLCVTFQISIGPQMTIWHLRHEPIRKSSNDLFDDSARVMLEKLIDERTPLPEPPPEVQETFRGRTLRLLLVGDPNGDFLRCR